MRSLAVFDGAQAKIFASGLVVRSCLMTSISVDVLPVPRRTQRISRHKKKTPAGNRTRRTPNDEGILSGPLVGLENMLNGINLLIVQF